MSTQFGLRASRFPQDPSAGKDAAANNTPDPAVADAFARAVAVLRLALPSAASDHPSFLHRVADEARQFTNADSAVIALRQSSTTVCVARSGPVGPPPGAALDSRSGISAECLREGRSLRCKDSETDPRVDGEVCRRLGIRSIAVVPVFEGSDVGGLVEVFSPRPYAFQDQHLSMLEQLAALVAECKASMPSASILSVTRDTSVLVRRDQEALPVPDRAAPLDTRSWWREAFNLRPYQIAIAIGFLILDLVTIYRWR